MDGEFLDKVENLHVEIELMILSGCIYIYIYIDNVISFAAQKY